MDKNLLTHSLTNGHANESQAIVVDTLLMTLNIQLFITDSLTCFRSLSEGKKHNMLICYVFGYRHRRSRER